MPARVVVLPLLTQEALVQMKGAGSGQRAAVGGAGSGQRATVGGAGSGQRAAVGGGGSGQRAAVGGAGSGQQGAVGGAGSGDGGRARLAFAFSGAELEQIAAGIRAGGFDVRLQAPELLPPEAYHPGRRQWQSTPILHHARERLKTLGDLSARLLVLTDADIYEPGLSFTGGMAELGGRLALVSLARLQSGDRSKLVTRAVKEALHEVGHTLGLEHCRDHDCVMFLSRSIADSDLKRAAFCPKCRAVAGRAIG